MTKAALLECSRDRMFGAGREGWDRVQRSRKSTSKLTIGYGDELVGESEWRRNFERVPILDRETDTVVGRARLDLLRVRVRLVHEEPFGNAFSSQASSRAAPDVRKKERGLARIVAI